MSAVRGDLIAEAARSADKTVTRCVLMTTEPQGGASGG